MSKTDIRPEAPSALSTVRYVYVKNGDAVDQVRRFVVAGKADGSGPDAFIGDFLRVHAEDEVLVLCRSKPSLKLEAQKYSSREFSSARPLARHAKWLGSNPDWSRNSAVEAGQDFVRLYRRNALGRGRRV